MISPVKISCCAVCSSELAGINLKNSSRDSKTEIDTAKYSTLHSGALIGHELAFGDCISTWNIQIG